MNTLQEPFGWTSSFSHVYPRFGGSVRTSLTPRKHFKGAPFEDSGLHYCTYIRVRRTNLDHYHQAYTKCD